MAGTLSRCMTAIGKLLEGSGAKSVDLPVLLVRFRAIVVEADLFTAGVSGANAGKQAGTSASCVVAPNRDSRGRVGNENEQEEENSLHHLCCCYCFGIDAQPMRLAPSFYNAFRYPAFHGSLFCSFCNFAQANFKDVPQQISSTEFQRESVITCAKCKHHKRNGLPTVAIF